jgi:H+/Cl- antiporter ClcA
MRQFLFFFGFWYFFFLFSYGTNLPAGLFSPGIVMGIAYGQIWYKILSDPNYIGKDVDPAL